MIKYLLFLCWCLNAIAHSTLKSSLDEIRLSYKIPGMGAALLMNGEFEAIEVSGVRKIGFKTLIEREDTFHLGSCTKAMTATLLATFVEEGKLDWTSSLEEVLPNIDLHDEFRKITVQDLLTHHGRVIRDPDDSFYDFLSPLPVVYARKLLTRKILGQSPTFDSDTFNYSNTGYIILGHILEEISGKSWEMLINERIFSPLEMKSCGFGPTSNLNDVTPSSVWGHFIDESTNELKSIHLDNALFYGPAGSVHCSMRDWAKFLQLHIEGFNNSDSAILKKESFQKLHQISPDKNESYTYGAWNRLQRIWANGDVLTHTGSNLYNYANVWVAPHRKAAIISVANIRDNNAFESTDLAITKIIDLYFRNP